MNWIATTDPGRSRSEPVLRTGRELSGSRRFSAAAWIDAGQVTYVVSAWLGSLAGTIAPTLTYTFSTGQARSLAPTAQLGPPTKTGTVLIETSHSDILPTGTRRVHIALTFPGDDSMADDIAFALAAPSGPPVITPGGIISASRPVLGLR
jgi:hypothetical protein